MLIGQKFSQITSRLIKSIEFIDGSRGEIARPSKGSSGTKSSAFPQKESDNDILLRDTHSVPYDAEIGRQILQETEPAGIYKTVEVSVNGARPGSMAVPSSSF